MQRVPPLKEQVRQVDQGAGRLDRGEPVVIRADGVMLDYPVDVSLFLVGLGDPVVEDGLVQDGDFGAAEPVFEHSSGFLRLSVPQSDVGVHRIIVDHALFQGCPALLPIESLAFPVFVRKERILRGQCKTVIGRIEGLVIERDVGRIPGGGRVDAEEHSQRHMVHPGNEVALCQVQGSVETEFRVSGPVGDPVLYMRVQERGIQVVLEIPVEDPVVQAVTFLEVRIVERPCFHDREIRFQHLVDALFPGKGPVQLLKGGFPLGLPGFRMAGGKKQSETHRNGQKTDEPQDKNSLHGNKNT